MKLLSLHQANTCNEWATRLALTTFLILFHVESGFAQTRTLISPNEQANGNFGFSLSGVPDLSGDGLGDFCIGAPDEDGGTTDSGRAYVYHGRTGNLLYGLVSPVPRFQGRFGAAIAGGSDCNGDARGEVLIGADYEDVLSPNDNAGKAHLFSGSSGAWIRSYRSPMPQTEGHFGYAVSGSKDLNGDNCGDWMVGAYKEPIGVNTQAGRVYVFDGVSTSTIHSLVSPNFASSGHFGVSVSTMNDATGDGISEIIVGADQERPSALVNAGRAYVFNGATGLVIWTLISPAPVTSGRFGVKVSGVPDATGDGLGDIAIGESGTGKVYVFNGATGALVWTLVSPGGGLLGSAIAGIQDYNSDSRGDILCGAPLESGTATFSGKAYVFSGATGAVLATLHSPNAMLNGAFGAAVAGLPDAFSDGEADVIVGAPDEYPSPSPIEAGRAYEFFRLNPARDGWLYE